MAQNVKKVHISKTFNIKYNGALLALNGAFYLNGAFFKFNRVVFNLIK